MADETITEFDDDDVGDPPAPDGPPDDLTEEELEVLRRARDDPDTPSADEVS